jgi:hypothetical protein
VFRFLYGLKPLQKLGFHEHYFLQSSWAMYVAIGVAATAVSGI